MDGAEEAPMHFQEWRTEHLLKPFALGLLTGTTFYTDAVVS
jgi:hypothetical protein